MSKEKRWLDKSDFFIYEEQERRMKVQSGSGSSTGGTG